MCVFYAIGGGGGGKEGRRGAGLSRASLKPRFPTCEKRNPGTFFDTEKSQHAKVPQIPSNLKNRNKIGTYASL